MIYTVPDRDPELGYIDNWLWLPKKRIAVETLRRSLRVPYVKGDHLEYIECWRESRYHLGVPRCRIDPATLLYDVVDLRPTEYERADIRSSIELDALMPERDEQTRAYDDVVSATGGILNLSCVSGDVILSLNRGGKGFRMSAEEVLKRLRGDHRYTWDRAIPTKIRSECGGVVRLNRLLGMKYAGDRQVFKIITEAGKELKATGDHRILTPSGYTPLEELAAGDYVISDLNIKPGCKTKPVYNRLGWPPGHPYLTRVKRNGQSGYYYLIEEHRAVAEAELNGLSLGEYRDRFRSGKLEGLKFIDPNCYHVHHKDEDHTNNDPTNLDVLEKDAHLDSHRPGYSAFGIGTPTADKIVSIRRGKVEPVFDVMCEEPHNNFSADGVIVENCGKGKTVIMLHCLAKWGKPALIINDKVHILKQWKKEISRFLEVPSVGWVQGSPEKWDWKEHPIVLASLKTLTIYHDKLPFGMSRRFGVVVWDEIHHLAALGFSTTAHLFLGNRYGATATSKRPDGNQVVYYWHVGREVHINKTQDLIPTVKVVQSKTTIDERHQDCLDVSGNVHAAKLGIHVGRQPEEIELGLKYVREAMEKGRDLVAVSTSKEHSRRLHELVPDSGVIDADVDPDLRGDVLAQHKATFGTIHILSEAINKQSLDSLLLLMEFTSEIWMEQAVGRIQRLLEGKKEIRVVMIWHVNVPRLRKRGEEMMRLFREMGYKVEK